MDAARYTITPADRPFLLHALSAWKTLHHCELDKSQLLTWLERYPKPDILHAFEIVQVWADERKPSETCYLLRAKYANGVLRARAQHLNKWNELFASKDAPTISLTLEQAEIVLQELSVSAPIFGDGHDAKKHAALLMPIREALIQQIEEVQ